MLYFLQKKGWSHNQPFFLKACLKQQSHQQQSPRFQLRPGVQSLALVIIEVIGSQAGLDDTQTYASQITIQTILVTEITTNGSRIGTIQMRIQH